MVNVRCCCRWRIIWTLSSLNRRRSHGRQSKIIQSVKNENHFAPSRCDSRRDGAKKEKRGALQSAIISWFISPQHAPRSFDIHVRDCSLCTNLGSLGSLAVVRVSRVICVDFRLGFDLTRRPVWLLRFVAVGYKMVGHWPRGRTCARVEQISGKSWHDRSPRLSLFLFLSLTIRRSVSSSDTSLDLSLHKSWVQRSVKP